MVGVKNLTEIEGTRTAHQRDAVALTRFLAWIDREAPSGALTEIDSVEALVAQMARDCDGARARLEALAQHDPAAALPLGRAQAQGLI